MKMEERKFLNRKLVDSIRKKEERNDIFPTICRFVLALCPPPRGTEGRIEVKEKGGGGVEAQEEKKRGRRSVLQRRWCMQQPPSCTRDAPASLHFAACLSRRDFPRNPTTPRTVFHQLFLLPHSCILPSPPPPLRAACPTPLTYNAPQQPPPSLYLPSTALSHALPSLTLSCFLSLSTFLVNEVPISPPTTKLEKDLVLGTSCKRVLREICLARKASVYARWLK